MDVKTKAFEKQRETAKKNYYTASQINTTAKAINSWLVIEFTNTEECFSAKLSNYQDIKYFINLVFSFHMYLSELEFIYKLR